MEGETSRRIGVGGLCIKGSCGGRHSIQFWSFCAARSLRHLNMAYLKRFTGKGESENASDVPQSQRLPGQVANSAGGFSFEVCPLTR